ncbi:MAG: hypothetical protein ACRC2V_00510 [Xenococcaceae cyanobacterium]
MAGFREITKDEAHQVERLVRARKDPYRECGGWIHQNGKVEVVDHWGICRSSVVLHPDELPKDLKALWISSPLQKPANYIDDCCDACEDKNAVPRKMFIPPVPRSLEEIKKLEAIEKEENPNHHLSSGQIAWADKMWAAGVKTSILLYKAIGEKGVWDFYDPCKDKKKKAIGINLHPISELNGLALKDPESLKLAEKVAIRERKKAEREIYEAWLQFVQVEQVCRDRKNKVDQKLLDLSPVWVDRHRKATERIKLTEQQRAKYESVAPWKNCQVVTAPPKQRYQLHLPEAQGVPISLELLKDPRFAPPIEAYEYIEVGVL